MIGLFAPLKFVRLYPKRGKIAWFDTFEYEFSSFKNGSFGLLGLNLFFDSLAAFFSNLLYTQL